MQNNSLNSMQIVWDYMLGITQVSFHSTEEEIPYCDTWDNNTKEFQLNFKFFPPIAVAFLVRSITYSLASGFFHQIIIAHLY